MDTKIIKLSKKSNGSIIHLNSLIPLTLEQVNIIKRDKDILDKNIINILIENKIIKEKEDIKLVIHIGQLDTFTNYESVVYQFPQSKRQIIDKKPIQYRNYGLKLEDQKEYMHIVVAASSERVSYLSAIKACNSEYGMILKTQIYE